MTSNVPTEAALVACLQRASRPAVTYGSLSWSYYGWPGSRPAQRPFTVLQCDSLGNRTEAEALTGMALRSPRSWFRRSVSTRSRWLLPTDN